MKNLAEILATTIPLAYDMQVSFKERKSHQQEDAVRACYYLRLASGELEAAGERLYSIAFLQQVPNDLLKKSFQSDADGLIDSIPK